jgi:hypothetical protein
MWALVFCLIFHAYAITEEQFNFLVKWRLCPNSPYNSICDNGCSFLICRNNTPIQFSFDPDVWNAFNQTDKDAFQLFPELEEILMIGAFRTVALFPEISFLRNLQELDIRVRVTGTFPTELATLRNLKKVFINSQLTGTLPLELGNLNITEFHLSSSEGRLYGPSPNFTNAIPCIFSSGNIGDPRANPGLFCECYGSCKQRGYEGITRNRCSETCGTRRSSRCNTEIATLGYGYVCIDACQRCPTECAPNIENTAYLCPGDPTLPPSPPPTPTPYPTIDGDDDDDLAKDSASGINLF